MWEKLHARLGSMRLSASPRLGASVLIVVIAASLLHRYPGNQASYSKQLPHDFAIYERALRRVESGQTPYIAGEFSPYKYSPGILTAFKVLPPDPQNAWVVFSSFCIACLACALLIGSRYASWSAVLWLGVGVALAWKGILETLDYGQIEFVILLLVVISAAVRRGQPLLSGFLAGSLPWIKLPWILLLFPLILINTQSIQGPGVKERKTRILITGYFLSWFFWGAALPSVVFGPDRSMHLTQDWFQVLRHQPHELYFNDINQSVWVTLIRWIGDPALAIGLGGLFCAYLLGSLIARTLRTIPNREFLASATPWLLLTQLLNPLSWRWGSIFVVGAPLAMQIAGPRVRFYRWFLFGAVVGLFLVQLNPVVQLLGYHHWTEFHEYGVVTMYWIAILLLCLGKVSKGHELEQERLKP